MPLSIRSEKVIRDSRRSSMTKDATHAPEASVSQATEVLSLNRAAELPSTPFPVPLPRTRCPGSTPHATLGPGAPALYAADMPPMANAALESTALRLPQRPPPRRRPHPQNITAKAGCPLALTSFGYACRHRTHGWARSSSRSQGPAGRLDVLLHHPMPLTVALTIPRYRPTPSSDRFASALLA